VLFLPLVGPFVFMWLVAFQAITSRPLSRIGRPLDLMAN
jgi:hypothetical protein